MDPPNRTSALPRISRLPRPGPSAIPRPTPIIRPSPSTESLASAKTPYNNTGPELRNPRLRASASSSKLNSTYTNASGRNSCLRASISRDQLRTGNNSRASTSTPIQLQPPVTPSRRTVTPSRRTSIIMGTQPLQEEPDSETKLPEADDLLFKRKLTLTRRPSEVFSTSPLENQHDDAANTSTLGALPSDLNETNPETPKTRKSRPSLAERTIDTLANIPSSPAQSRTSSSFFDNARPGSRADSRSSRPGSSYKSDASGRPSSRAVSRPGSSSGLDEPRPPNRRDSMSTFKAPLSTIEGTPRSAASIIQTPKVPVVKRMASRQSVASASKLPASSIVKPGDDRSPSLAKKTYGNLPPKSASKTVVARPLKPRASLNGLIKKQSLQAIDLAAANSVQSLTTSWDGTIAPAGSASIAEFASPSTNRKSSIALRDQISRAKAAKRAAAGRLSAAHTSVPENEAPIVPSDDGFDFGVMHEDPFNLRQGENPKKKVLNQRVSSARTTGKLNIAALDLKEIPVEVLKMYDLENIGANDASWAESVDLTRLIAADNELESLDDFVFPDSSPEEFDHESEQGNIFGGLETIDLHGNLLVGIPMGFRRLAHLTSLNLSSNRLTNNCFDTIGQMTALRDLKLAKNLFFGPLSSDLSKLTSLEILDLHGNNASALPRKIENMSRLRILNLSENSFESLPFDELAKLPLTELLISKNKLTGTLIEESIESLPQLQTLDVSSNQLTRIVPLGTAISFPELHALSLSMNRLQGLPDLTSWTSLLTLTVDGNNISGIPNSFTALDKLRHADFSGNDIRVVPPEISRMDNLKMLRLSGNPLRDRKFVSITTEELKEILASRLEPPPPYQEAGAVGPQSLILGDKKDPEPFPNAAVTKDDPAEDSRSDVDDDFATPPTSAPHSPARSRSHTVSSLRSRSHTLSNQIWPVKAGGLLDRSRTESSTLHPVVCSKVAVEHQVKQVHLHHNLFPSLPNSLSFFAETLVSLSLAQNQLVGETYLAETMEFPALKELNLSSNRITGLDPLTKFLLAPMLEKLDVSVNRINALPDNLKEAFPSMSVLMASNNQIMDLEPEMIKGLKFVDASSNDISRLNPRIGLLGGPGGLEKLDIMGNRFRVPRYNVLERGTEATLRWLRGRVPVAEMATWKGDDVDDGFEELD